MIDIISTALLYHSNPQKWRAPAFLPVQWSTSYCMVLLVVPRWMQCVRASRVSSTDFTHVMLLVCKVC